MRVSVLALGFAAVAVAQNCGPSYGNTTCDAGDCCSQYGWCDTDMAHCDPATCIKAFSGPGSSCASSSSGSNTASTTSKATSSTKTTAFPSTYISSIPNIDVCGSAQGGVSCPGAGTNGYFYRCCSSHGHCGPKNDMQDQSLYCGPSAGCQSGFGDCAANRSPPPLPSTPAKTAQMGETCGPIVNAKCASGLCCSGSNFCGKGAGFCGSANWCQEKWGGCEG